MTEVPASASDAAIEAAYPLSPMQRDMLLHSMSSPGSGAYVQHAICDLRESLEPSLLERAWRRVVERHSILRTAFCIQAAGGPIQEVHRHVDVPWAHLDWRGTQPAEQEMRFDAYLDADRLGDFAIDRPAPMRIALFRLGDAHFRFLLTYHHALLDGRSVRIVLRELFDLYDALAASRDLELPPPHPYREYVDWLARRDTLAAEAFWRGALEGFVAPPRLPERRVQSTDEGREGYATAELRSGDSLLAIRMIDTMKRACGVSVVPEAFFAEPTIEGLSASVRAAIGGEDGKEPSFVVASGGAPQGVNRA